LSAPVTPPALDRAPVATTGVAPAEAVSAAARILSSSSRPLVMIGRVSADAGDFQRRIALAERLGAAVLTDIKTGASFPTRHALHPHPPSLYVTGAAAELVREADAILSLDWIDLGGTLRQACGGENPRARVIQCSLEPYIHNGWNADYQALPPPDPSILAAPGSLLASPPQA